MAVYKHTQIGYVIIVSLLIAMGFIFYKAGGAGHLEIVYLAVLFSLVILSVFATLTVQVDQENLRIWFGVGIIRKTFSLKEIDFCRVVKNPWYSGWGIRIGKKYILFNVSGFKAVELKMKNGKTYRIGTDDPEELTFAIQNYLTVK